MKITFMFFMFRDVPGCSGMFHVPGFIDALYWEDPKPFKDRPAFIVESRLTKGRSSHHTMDSAFWNPGNLCLRNPESWVLEPGIQPKESGTQLTIRIQNPRTTEKYWNQVCGIRNPQCGFENPRLSWITLHEATSLQFNAYAKGVFL